MGHWLRPSAYNSVVLFVLMGAFGTVVAWTGRIFRKPLEGDDPYATLRHNVSVGP